MNSQSTSATRVIIDIGDTADDAQALQNHLRNAGHAIRTEHISSIDQLPEAMEEHRPLLILSSLTLGEEFVREIFDVTGRRCPLVVISDVVDSDTALGAINIGARDAVSSQSLEHFAAVVLREMEYGEALRSIDVSERKRQELKSAHQALMDDAGDAIAYVSEGIVLAPNPAFCELLKLASTEIDGLPLMDFIEKPQRNALKKQINKCASGKIEEFDVEISFIASDDSTHPSMTLFKRIMRDGEALLEMLIRSVADDANNSEPSGQSADRIALWQQLPGFIEAADEQSGGHGIMIIQIDEFSDLENRLGFEETEELVLGLGQELQELFTDRGRLYRLSTHEFIGLLNSPSAAELEKIANNTNAAAAQCQLNTQTHETHVTVTNVMYPVAPTDNGQRVIDAIRESARKLAAKGGNQALFMGPKAEETTRLREEQQRAGEIREAVQSGHLSLVYQSIASLEGDEVRMFDVLVRMQETDGSEVLARNFLPIAERFNMMPMIDHWVVGHSMTTIREKLAKNRPTNLIVKLSEATIADPTPFIKWLADRVQRPNDIRKHLIFSIDERIITDHIGSAKSLINQLHEHGMRVALSHFGQSEQSHRLLETFKIDLIRLTPEFTRNLADNKVRSDLAELMDRARDKNIKTIATEVEDANAMAQLWQAGVNLIVGNHIQEPEVIMADSTVGI